ncbi:exodeoxyribonuclease VII large subunit [Desulfobaculum bizertense]|uniref:Exodeoxyribonuclease 7 large subunit n=1 Tax=Desulfobaculum bizertense DSM 18034 TaxID=1121442 RepID=A0A1T4WHB4_9BACT|nr:exodeoxyribonuclease VII large subunit [Desulfobaculum bizertense]SKA76597.1 Exodeoxyribonuclease VII large subunit [Desulfobaculum bizertense DSM 18034]
MPHIFEVSELTRAVGDVLESQFPFIWVKGQVGNVTRPRSGHIYFSLRDANSQLSVVWFKRNQRCFKCGEVDPLTGEVYEEGFQPQLEEGQEVVCAGRLNVYAARGQYQLVAELVQEQGLGQLHLEFERLKAMLAEKGYFDAERKRALPYHPQRVAVVTAPTGAAVRDFLRIADERGWGCEIRIYPSLVQGDAAPAQIAAALRQVASDGWAELVAVIRGGGSLEDLWAFNTEAVADAIFQSPVPVLSGVGHEVDTSLADFVADARAATPTHAAQMLWPERDALMQDIDALEGRLVQRACERLVQFERQLQHTEKAVSWLSPRRRLNALLERFSDSLRALERNVGTLVDRSSQRLSRCEQRMSDSFGPRELSDRERRFEAAVQGLERSAGLILDKKMQELAFAQDRLESRDPLKPLERGYGLITVDATGRFLRSVDEVQEGEQLSLTVRDGELAAQVTAKRRR